MKDRAKDKVSKSVLDRYVPADQGNSDDGEDFWPPYHEDRAPNGNMIEPDDIAERHSICGDPRLVSGALGTFSAPPTIIYCQSQS